MSYTFKLISQKPYSKKIIPVIIILHTFVLLYRTWYTEDADYDRIYIALQLHPIYGYPTTRRSAYFYAKHNP